MPIFRKIPVTISATYFDGSEQSFGEVLHWMQYHRTPFNPTYDPQKRTITVRTLEGWLTVGTGHYIIRGVEGEFYPCEKNIFKKTYEPVIQNAK